ncbi:MAG TPA: PhoH family protein [Candidatus Brocadiia bacterium]|nr:PhoH family protein [Candidatus Brocadiia bacterium]
MAEVIEFGDDTEVRILFGARDCFLRKVRDSLGVQLVARGRQLRMDGDPEAVRKATAVFEDLLGTVRKTGSLRYDQVNLALKRVDAPVHDQPEPARETGIEAASLSGKASPRTEGQRAYIEAIQGNELVFCIGPAGTGKTFLAVALALEALKRGRVRRIVLARPAVEAGESLGFLPGDIQEKVNPYLRPLYDALHDLMDSRAIVHYLDSQIIEILPLAYMRGRTLNDAFIILDEAQNCTVGQMKTFLTRLGVNSKVVVTGDITQTDLPTDQMSGLIDVQDKLTNVRGVAYVYLTVEDIVRHRLVRDIVNAYDGSRTTGNGNGVKQENTGIRNGEEKGPDAQD